MASRQAAWWPVYQLVQPLLGDPVLSTPPGDNMAPPEREKPGPTARTGSLDKPVGTTQTDRLQSIAHTGRWCGGRAAALRRDAALRLPPLGRCSCIRDPEIDRHHCDNVVVTERMADAAVQAAEHLTFLGLPAVFDAKTTAAVHEITGRWIA